MIKEFEYKGNWRLPESETWFDGTLKYDPNNGARLEIFGTFNSFLDTSSKNIVLGRTTAGDITLIDVWFKKTKSNLNGVTVGIYTPVMIIEGQHFNHESEISFRHVTSRLFNSFQWFNKSGIEKDLDYNHGNYEISYNKISPITINLNDKCSGKIIFDSPVDFKDFDNEININEQSYFSLDYSTKTHYEDILNDLRYLCGFITLFTYEQSYPMSITFRDDDYIDENQNHNRPKFIKCIYQNNSYDSKYKLRRPHEHLVKYINIQDSFPDILKKWYGLFFKHESVFNLMLYTFRKKNSFTTEKFMDTIRALETYHRNTHNNQRISGEKYEHLVSKILTSVELNRDDEEWLTNKLRGNEPSLNKRLKELIRENQNSFIKANIHSIKKYSQEVTDSRNYFTHFDKSAEKKALKGKELYVATLIAQGLLYSCISNDLGLKEEHFEEGLKYLLHQ